MDPNPNAPYPLGRWHHHDVRNRSFPIRTLLATSTVPAGMTIRTWPRAVGVFDQRSESSCTAQAAVGMLRTAPFDRKLARGVKSAYDAGSERYGLYRAAQEVDPWPGGEPEYEGSSTDAPLRVLRNKGHIKEWRWCFGLNEALFTIANYGPIVAGTNWYSSMFTHTPAGLVRVQGDVIGGHAYEVVEYDVRNQLIGCWNSWGARWGRRGQFWLTVEDFGRLLGEGGEAATVVV